MGTSPGKQVGHLRDLLKDAGIASDESLRHLIRGQSQLENDGVIFHVLRSADLGLDSEDRTYQDNFVYHRTIFDCANINILNSQVIRLHDCVVLGSVHIANKTEDNDVSVTLDTTAMLGQLLITGLDGTFPIISPTDVRVATLRIDFLCCMQMHLSGVVCESATLSRLRGDVLHTWQNGFGKLEVVETTFRDVHFPANQVPLTSWRSSDRKRLKAAREKPFNAFAYEPIDDRSDEEWKAFSQADAARREIETLEFLSARSQVPHNKRDSAQIKYLRAIVESRGPFSRAFVVLTGAFTKPWRIAGLAALTIAVFSLLYSMIPYNFADCKIKTVWDALYFSGITFTTIGYGDIAPGGWARGLAVIEGLLGIVLSSSFVVSM